MYINPRNSGQKIDFKDHEITSTIAQSKTDPGKANAAVLMLWGFGGQRMTLVSQWEKQARGPLGIPLPRPLP